MMVLLPAHRVYTLLASEFLAETLQILLPSYFAVM